MRTEEQFRINEYFGASNSFSGFSSCFGEIFAPEKFEKIFILKGGPGTGKSSLMRKVSDFGDKHGIRVQKIYCSSDPASLDGVILGEGKRVAILDGTAPHMTDPQYPGAKEDIINLGESFDTKKLRASAERITRLANAKKQAYSEAYDVLALAGKMFDYITLKIKKDWIYNLAEIKITSLLNIFPVKSATHTPRIKRISAFGKEGVYKIPDKSCKAKKVCIASSSFVGNAFMNFLYDRLKKIGAVRYVCPSALSPEIIDRIYTDDFVFLNNEVCDETFDLSELTPVSIEGHSELVSAYEKCLNISSAYFSVASENHFLLEDIYKECVDFSRNDKILERILEQTEECIRDEI